MLYNTPYSVRSIDDKEIQQWMTNTKEESLYIPSDDIPNRSTSQEAVQVSSSRLSRQALDTTKEKKQGDVSSSRLSRQALNTMKEKKQGDTCLRRSLRILGTTEDKKHGISAEQGISKVCIIYDDRMLNHIPPPPKPGREPHNEIPARISTIYDRLEKEGLLQRCSVYKSEPVGLKHVLDVHEDHYVIRIIQGNLQVRRKNEEDDMFLSDGSLDAILLAAGGAVKSCEMVVSKKHLHSFAVVRPPGHHAKVDEERGFCFFNNVAIATKYLMKYHNVKKVLILDWDLHFGDGTSKIFLEDRNVLFISMHRHPYWPNAGFASSVGHIGTGEGKGFNCNLCWEEGIKDDDLFAAFEYVVMPLANEFDPDIILISGGFDAALDDKVGDCKITHSGYATVLHKLLQLKKSTVTVLEGGYNVDVLAECCASCVKVLLGDTSDVRDIVEYYPLKSTWITILELRRLLKAYWNCFNSDIPEEAIARTHEAIARTHPKGKVAEVLEVT